LITVLDVLEVDASVVVVVDVELVDVGASVVVVVEVELDVLVDAGASVVVVEVELDVLVEVVARVVVPPTPHGASQLWKPVHGTENSSGPGIGPVLGLMSAGASPVITSNCSGPQPRAKVMVVTPASTAKLLASTRCWGHG
jgi:hypothetical protein